MSLRRSRHGVMVNRNFVEGMRVAQLVPDAHQLYIVTADLDDVVQEVHFLPVIGYALAFEVDENDEETACILLYTRDTRGEFEFWMPHDGPLVPELLGVASSINDTMRTVFLGKAVALREQLMTARRPGVVVNVDGLHPDEIRRVTP